MICLPNVVLAVLLIVTAGSEVTSTCLWSLCLASALVHTARHEASFRFGSARAAKAAELLPTIDLVLTDGDASPGRVREALHPLVRTVDLSTVSLLNRGHTEIK